MNLPNYFLADLPAEAILGPAMLAEACQTLKRNRERYLAGRTTQGVIKSLAEVAEAWRRPDYPLRALALEKGPAATGFSRATLAAGLDSFFKELTAESLLALVEQDLGHARALDAMSHFERGRSAIAIGPEFLVHIAAGNLPNPTLASVVLGVLAKSAQFVKCAAGTSFLPRLFAHSIYEAEPKLGACIEIAEWRGGNQPLEEVLFAEADCLTAAGTDETLAAIRQRVPVKTRFIGYGHRVSFAFVTHRVLSTRGAPQVVSQAASDIVAWNQLGCLSPHVLYVQPGGEIGPERFAEMLADELERREQTEPRGELPVKAAAVIATRRAFYEVRAAHSPGTRLWHSLNSTAWTVVFEADPRFQVSCLNRFVYVKAVASLAEALHSADAVQGQVSTVGLAASEDEARDLATELARWGVTRVCPLGRMQNPPLTWRHDGRPALGDLVTWTDWEM
jgi:Acyl-CoA reductase (LuxC)